jgi:hypothetical protein
MRLIPKFGKSQGSGHVVRFLQHSPPLARVYHPLLIADNSHFHFRHHARYRLKQYPSKVMFGTSNTTCDSGFKRCCQRIY